MEDIYGQSGQVPGQSGQESPNEEIQSWKALPGFSRYLISRDGKCFSIVRSRLIKGQELRDKGPLGHIQWRLRGDNGKARWIKIHRAVALLYVENPHGRPEVKHINGLKADNRAANLEWVTHSETISYRVGPGYWLGKHHREETRSRMSEAKRGIRHPKFKGWYHVPGSDRRWTSAAEAVKHLEVRVSSRTVSRRCTNPVWRHLGWWFEPVITGPNPLAEPPQSAPCGPTAS